MTRVNKPDGRYQRDRQEGHNGERETRLGERPTSARARCSECFVEVWRVEMDCGLRAERPGVDV